MTKREKLAPATREEREKWLVGRASSGKKNNNTAKPAGIFQHGMWLNFACVA
jgi:hypothetical protein